MKRSLLLVFLLVLVSSVAHAQSNATLLFAELRGSNENPANNSTAVGSAFVTIDANNLVTFEVNIGSVQNVTASHIHGPAGAGVNAGVKVGFASSASAFSNGRVKGTIQISDAALATDIKANPQNYYVNVHSSQFGGGEIRGQLAPAKEFLVSIAGNVTTGAGDKFVTDARVFNPSSTAKAVALVEYFVSGGGSTNATASKTLEIPPRGEAVLDDVTGASQLNSVGSTGALRVTSSVPLAVTSNIYNDQRSANPSRGTFGQFVPAITIANALNRGVIPHLSNKTRDAANPSGFRTNIGFFNPNQSSATVNLTLRDAAGTSLATATIALGGLAQQQNAITTYFPSVDLSNAPNLTVSFDSTLPILGYGANNDNISGDSILVPAQPDGP